MLTAILGSLPVIGGILRDIFGLIDQKIEDKDKANELKAAVQMKMLEMDHQEMQTLVNAQASIVKAEAEGQSWIQRNWRPILMMMIIGIIFNNYVLFPYLSLFTTKAIMLQLPDWMPELMKIGVGGYIIGRSGEKIVKVWKNKAQVLPDAEEE